MPEKASGTTYSIDPIRFAGVKKSMAAITAVLLTTTAVASRGEISGDKCRSGIIARPKRNPACGETERHLPAGVAEQTRSDRLQSRGAGQPLGLAEHEQPARPEGLLEPHPQRVCGLGLHVHGGVAKQ